MIRAVYILVSGGVCVFSRSYDPELADPYLLSSFVSAMASFSKEAMGDDLRGIESDGKFIFIADHKQVTTVVIADGPDEVTSTLIDYIGLNFISRFGKDIQQGRQNLPIFDKFTEVLDKLIPEHLKFTDSVKPREPLDSLAIVELPKELKDIAMLLVRERSITEKKAALELGISLKKSTRLLEKLVNLGRAGRKLEGRNVIYFV
ncbi:MAG: hypothetical protein BAJATHORv1_40192 [Candidatus Thorarchaeota archaeon]|nr:MAG: hypothetical protein BAJATHORv1_40192 [Candidatus Thorarchaeota archaeon]